MRLSHKVAKLQTGQAFKSAQACLRRSFLTRHRGVRLNPERLIGMIDQDAFEAIRKRHAVIQPGEAWPKYLDLPKWMAVNLHRVRELGLDCGRRQRILDLGCGAGYFLFIARSLGHDVLGLDIDEVPMFGEMMHLLGLDRVVARVERFVPLPQLGTKFDLITAFMICFNGHKSPDLWGREEWQFFLNDLETHLTDRGRICLGFNPENDGRYCSDELRDYFTGRGAQVSGNHVLLGRSRSRRITQTA